jgi:hypothetical protein
MKALLENGLYPLHLLHERPLFISTERGGLGLGAAHQTGWTGLVANLIKRRYALADHQWKQDP